MVNIFLYRCQTLKLGSTIMTMWHYCKNPNCIHGILIYTYGNMIFQFWCPYVRDATTYCIYYRGMGRSLSFSYPPLHSSINLTWHTPSQSLLHTQLPPSLGISTSWQRREELDSCCFRFCLSKKLTLETIKGISPNSPPPPRYFYSHDSKRQETCSTRVSAFS